MSYALPGTDGVQNDEVDEDADEQEQFLLAPYQVKPPYLSTPTLRNARYEDMVECW